MTPKPRTRDMKKRYTLSHKKGDDLVWQRYTREPRHKVAVEEGTGKVFKPDRRRWNSNVAGGLGNKPKISGTAKELYVGGVELRGSGGKNRKKRRKEQNK